ncbi:hypothetical protein [Millisia brevis]|uniref:hypothetical protein n=1 Tax=Millisia brevis TaxID=264148 RepID=UPI0012ED5D1C|nr:hypothetical protein [Millisia brevis]
MSVEYLHICSGCGTSKIRYRGTVAGFTCDKSSSARIGLNMPPTRQQRKATHYLEGHRR